MEAFKFNLNYQIMAKITDMGIRHLVEQHNKIMPFHLQTSYREEKAKEDSNGYRTFQMHDFMDKFGSLFMQLAGMVEGMAIVIPADNLIPITINEPTNEPTTTA